MKLVFISNYYNHHVRPLCEALYAKLGSDFKFIAASVMRQERKELGYQQETDPRFVLSAHEGEQQKQEAIRLINAADIVIAGAASDDLVAGWVKSGKPVFRFSERPFKRKPSLIQKVYHAINYRIRDFGNKSTYILCASGYAAGDYHSIGMYQNHTLKWGYFPTKIEYAPKELLSKKDPKTILWCGRFLDWKHPDDALRVASMLKSEGYGFRLDIIGTGEMKDELVEMADTLGVSDHVRFMGSMPPDQVREHMEKAGILLFTSDRFEGWGAVLNEAMNSGCAVAASHAAGSVPFLIRDNENGLIYKSGNVDMLYEKVRCLLDNPEKQAELGINAYKTIQDDWNAEVAAARIINVAEHLLAGDRDLRLYESGICSRAEKI